MKEYLIAQEFKLHGMYYYTVKAETMGDAITQVEEDPTLLPSDSGVISMQVLSYTEADDNYDS